MISHTCLLHISKYKLINIRMVQWLQIHFDGDVLFIAPLVEHLNVRSGVELTLPSAGDLCRSPGGGGGQPHT